MSLPDVDGFLARAGALRVLVVGDLMLDEYLWGKTERISPEAPVQVVEVERDELRLGGAGNVINNLVALGCEVQVASVLGDDGDGRLLRSLLQEQGIGTGGIFLAPGRITSRKTRVLASHQQMLRIDRESSTPLHAEQEEVLLHYLRGAADAFEVILVSDYLKGVLSETVLAALCELGRSRGIPVVVDPKGRDFSRYKGATVLTPNRREAQTAAGIDIRDPASLQAAGEGLLRELELEVLVLTRSEEGMSLFFRDGRHLHLPTEAREVFDVSGAGDTVLAFLGAALGCGLGFEAAARLANLAAGIVVGKLGTSTVSPDELRHAAALQSVDGGLKIRSRDSLAPLLAAARRQGRKVVFTNGCFDLLHVGHVRYLQKARQLGDLLVLGLNSDASIRRLKGPQRPLIGEEERAHILAALDCIDYVTIFDEDTPLELLEVLRPDILVKGGDYTPETVVGKELVESYGGRVELIQFVDGKSTTGIIERILETYR
jgi:D-beta-D-heptose 7-phosphate kinase / D-beta-D-heptose 1-phosphate adenosyltransferase